MDMSCFATSKSRSNDYFSAALILFSVRYEPGRSSDKALKIWLLYNLEVRFLMHLVNDLCRGARIKRVVYCNMLAFA